MVAPAGLTGNERVRNGGTEKGGPSHEGLTIELGQNGEKVK